MWHCDRYAVHQPQVCKHRQRDESDNLAEDWKLDKVQWCMRDGACGVGAWGGIRGESVEVDYWRGGKKEAR